MSTHNEKCLFTKDGWSIYKGEYRHASVKGQVLAYAYHHSCGELGGYKEITGDPTNCWHTGDLKQRCILCNEAVPDSIQTLVVLYQWEK